MDGRGDPPLGSPRRQPPPHASLARETSEDPPHPIQSLLSPRAPIDSKSGLRLLLLIPDGSGESVEEEEEDEESEVPSAASAGYTSRMLLTREGDKELHEKEETEVLSTNGVRIWVHQVAAASTGYNPFNSRGMLLPDQDVIRDLRDQTFSPLPGFRPTDLPPGVWSRLVELCGNWSAVFRPSPPPPVGPPLPKVAPPLFALIQARYKALAESVKGAAAFVKTLSESCIKNVRSVLALQQRIAKMEEQAEESVKVARSALEIAKESRVIQEKTYSLLKNRLDLLCENRKEGTIARLKTLVDIPGDIASMIAKLYAYALFLKQLNAIVEGVYGKKPPEAQVLPLQIEEMASVIQTFEFRESNYSLIGSVCRDLLNGLYATDCFFIETGDSHVSITSTIKKAEDGNDNEVSLQWELTDLKIKLATDMLSNGMMSVSGDVCEGLKETLSYSWATQNAAAGLTYQHMNGGFCGVIGSRPTKTLNLSGIFGVKAFSVGAEIGVDGSTRSLSKYEFAAGYDDAQHSASVSIANKCDLLRASLARKLWPGTSVGAEATYTPSSGEKALWLGVSHQYSEATLLKAKAKIAGDCEAAAAVQYKWNEKCSISLSCDVKYKDNRLRPRLGVGFTLMP